MEVILFVAMLITPIMAIVAFVLSFVNFRRCDALKKLVIELTRITYSSDPKKASIAEFGVSEL